MKDVSLAGSGPGSAHEGQQVHGLKVTGQNKVVKQRNRWECRAVYVRVACTGPDGRGCPGAACKRVTAPAGRGIRSPPSASRPGSQTPATEIWLSLRS